MPDSFADALNRIERYATALTLAMHVQDEVHAVVAASRMRSAIRRASAIRASSCGVWLDAIEDALDATVGSLCVAHKQIVEEDVQRLLEWIDAIAATTKRDARIKSPDVFRLNASELDLAGHSLRALHVLETEFVGSAMAFVDLSHARLYDSNLSRASLDWTSWSGAKAERCSFVASCLRDARLEGAEFIDCDFRVADLSTLDLIGRSGSLTTVFVRCDLRGSRWNGRSLQNVHFNECKFAGATGKPDFEGVEIVRPDLSADADGSQPGTPADVLRAWNQS